MPSHRPIITLLTDFGERDDYVGAMKGVILGIAPDAQLVDISHQIEPQNIRQAASILDNVYRYYPPTTTHIVVVDPGVGSERRPIAVRTGLGTFVAPDNGVLTHIYAKAKRRQVVSLENTKYWLPNPSMTFHGRDIFSPAGAHLAAGVTIEDLGPSLDQVVMLSLPQLTISPVSIRGEVVRIDHFGNVLTNIMPMRWVDDGMVEITPPESSPIRINAAKSKVSCGWHTINGLNTNYTMVPNGDPITLIGSSQELEIAINQGNASQAFDIKVGSPVTLQFG